MPAWTAVSAVSPGLGISSAWGNQVKDATDMGGAYRKRFRICRTDLVLGSTDGAISSAGPVSLPTVLQDNDSMAAGGFSTIRTAGVWWIGSNVQWMPNAVSAWRTHVLYENTTSSALDIDQKASYTGAATYTKCQYLGYLDVGRVLQVRLAQSSGTNVTIGTAWYSLTCFGFLVSS